MNEVQVGRLEELLARVQQNREVPRIASPVTHAAPVAAAAPPALPQSKPQMVARPERERPVVAEERVNIPDRMSMPQAKPAVARPVSTSQMSQMSPSQSVDRRDPTERSVRDHSAPIAGDARRRERSATPLEMAVEGELNRGTPVDLSAPASLPTPPGAQRSNTEPSMPAARAEAVTPSEGFDMPRTFEPEPPREPTRPIAQVVSKHAPQVDATFGAMLKRSLSLRPQ